MRQFQTAYQIKAKHYDEDHLEIAKSLRYIGQAHYELKQYDQAIEYFKKDLSISEPILGEGHKKLAETYRNLGFIYEILGNREQAQVYFKLAKRMNRVL